MRMCMFGLDSGDYFNLAFLKNMEILDQPSKHLNIEQER